MATSFEDAIFNAISIGGDGDTIAGGVRKRSSVFPTILQTSRARLRHNMREILTYLYQEAGMLV